MAVQTGTMTAQAFGVGAIVYTPGTASQVAVSTSCVSALAGTFYTIEFTDVPVGSYRLHLVDASANHLIAVDVTFTANTWYVTPDGVSVTDLETAFGPGPWGLGTGPVEVNVAVTVDAGGPYLGGIAVIKSAGGETLLWGALDGNGEIQFHLPAGDYLATVQSALGYAAHTPEAFTVGATPVSVALDVSSQTITPPSPPGTRSGYWLCIGADGQPAEGQIVTRRFLEPPDTQTGGIYDLNDFTATSDVDGKAVFTGLVPGAVYQFQVGDGPLWDITIPAGTSEIALQSITGVFGA